MEREKGCSHICFREHHDLGQANLHGGYVVHLILNQRPTPPGHPLLPPHPAQTHLIGQLKQRPFHPTPPPLFHLDHRHCVA